MLSTGLIAYAIGSLFARRSQSRDIQQGANMVAESASFGSAVMNGLSKAFNAGTKTQLPQPETQDWNFQTSDDMIIDHEAFLDDGREDY